VIANLEFLASLPFWDFAWVFALIALPVAAVFMIAVASRILFERFFGR
jgi:hypothetical protein